MMKELFQRERMVDHLKKGQEWDVLVIGGGATGLGVALDSATRGYKTLLLEQDDFAKGTSSRSTKLVHGGVRYLAQGQIGLVREALYERGLLHKNAGHLVKSQSFLIPTYTKREKLFYTLGLKTYDFLAGKLSLGKSIGIGAHKTMERLKTINGDGLKGGVVYLDGQFDDARLAVNLAQTLIENGGMALNYFKVTKLSKNPLGTIDGVEAIDNETNTKHRLKSKVVVNATGVFTDNVLKMDDKFISKTISPSQGVHLVLDRSFLPGKDAIMIPKTRDGRVLFLVPWYGKTIVGTTDTPLEENAKEPIALPSEIDFILSTANEYLTKKISKSDVLSVFAGLRPLAKPKSNSQKTKEISRGHKITVSKSGLITIMGGKWTTYRRMAEDVVDRAIVLKMLPHRSCQTKNLSIHGSPVNKEYDGNLYLQKYGKDAHYITELSISRPELSERLHPILHNIKAEVVWAVNCEMARTIEDVLARRTRILFLDARRAIEIAPTVARLMALELGKSQTWEKSQIEAFNTIANRYIIE